MLCHTQNAKPAQFSGLIETKIERNSHFTLNELNLGLYFERNFGSKLAEKLFNHHFKLQIQLCNSVIIKMQNQEV